MSDLTDIIELMCLFDITETVHWDRYVTLRKHAYSNVLKILQPKKENFQIKNFDIFLIFPQNIDCGYPLEPPRWGGSNVYPQSMFLAK